LMIHAKSLTERVQVTRVKRGMFGSVPKGLKGRDTTEKPCTQWSKSRKSRYNILPLGDGF
jgi:hypothetical protein